MKVSVYSLVYNHEKYLRSTLEGFVNQKTNFDYEVFVHDDASTDNSAKIIMEYAEKYPDIIKPIIQTENQFSKKTVRIFRDIILPRATGEYIACCEGDDYWTDENKLQTQVDFLDSHPEYSACAHDTVKLDMMTGEEQKLCKFTEDCDIDFADTISVECRCVHLSALMYRRVCNDFPPYYDKAVGFGDYYTLMHLALKGKFRYINKSMSLYRQGTESSWTRAQRNNTDRAAAHYLNARNLLEAIKPYADKKYEENIKKEMLFCEYQSHYYKGNYNALKKEPYKEIYKNQSTGYKLKIFLKQFLNPLYKIYRKKKYT